MWCFGVKTFYEVFLFIFTVAVDFAMYPPPYGNREYLPMGMGNISIRARGTSENGSAVRPYVPVMYVRTWRKGTLVPLGVIKKQPCEKPARLYTGCVYNITVLFIHRSIIFDLKVLRLPPACRPIRNTWMGRIHSHRNDRIKSFASAELYCVALQFGRNPRASFTPFKSAAVRPCTSM